MSAASSVHQHRGRDARVQALERGIAVLKAFDRNAPALTISEIAATTGLDRAAARRYLLTLQDLGYVGANDRCFFLRPRVLELGYGYLSTLGLPQLAQPHLARLASTIRESCAITVLDEPEIVYVAVANTDRSFSIRLTVGNRLPAYCTAMGRVLLASREPTQARSILSATPRPRHTSRTIQDLDRLAAIVEDIRSHGWAIGDEELEEGVHSVAVPVHDASGNVIAAASASTPTARVTTATLRNSLLDQLQDTAAAIEEDIAAPPDHSWQST